jgi:pimeloyl-ACP methyl ester carboxylesterase
MTGRGEAPPLLCVPGLGLDEDAWRPTREALGRLPAGDPSDLVAALPAYGRRPADDDDLRPSALGARLAHTGLADTSVPAVLMGHSASSQIVAHAARILPEQVSGLVLVGPTTDPRGASWARISERWLRTAMWERPGQVPVLARTYTRTGLSWMVRAMDAARREDPRRVLRELQCPVLVVRGRHDRICPEDWAETLVSAAPAGSRSVTLRRGAHMVPLTHGALLAAAVSAFLG